MITRIPILVTGSHRSGTKWVGEMIALSHDVVYIHEPFNISSYQRGVVSKEFNNWFMYITPKNENSFYYPLKKTIELRYDFFTDIRKNPATPQNLKMHIKEYLYFASCRLRGKRALIKDPKVMGWIHPFEHFLHQPLLMKDHLGSFSEEIVEYAAHPPNIIDQACFLWRIIYSVVHKYQKDHDDWIFLRHEDISRDPLQYFRALFDNLELEFTPRIQAIIEDYTDPSNPVEPCQNGNGLKRDSRSNIWSWRSRLTSSEIRHVREQVEDVSKYFYTDDDWSGKGNGLVVV